MAEMDKTFVEEAARSGAAEIELSRLAEDRAQSEEVKKFGRRIVEDHTEKNRRLTEIAASKRITPQEELDEEHKNIFKSLSNLWGEEFDREYIEAMVNDHEKVISEFEDETNRGEDDELKDFARNTLPVLREHLLKARDLSGKRA